MSEQQGTWRWTGWGNGESRWEKCRQCGAWQRLSPPQILCQKHDPAPSPEARKHTLNVTAVDRPKRLIEDFTDVPEVSE